MAFTTDDFNKIWASASPLTPYEFSDSNYQQGWNFIGSTPPARQMWDFLQKRNDEKAQYIFNNFLPLSGGNVTGSLSIAGNAVETVVASGSNYIRYDSGLQICWDTVSGITLSGVTLTFPAPFANTSYAVLAFASGYNVNANGIGYTSKTITSVVLNRGSETSAAANYLIVGYWK